MTTIKVYNLGNQETGTVELHDNIAESALNPYVIKDVVVAHQSALQQGTHKAKGRSEVAGSRKKLFRQKGTGNARVGSLQSPTRRHGGVAFGPVPRSHAVSVNKQIRKKALASVIGLKNQNSELMIVEDLKLQDHKTKNLVKLLQEMKLGKALFVFSETERNFELASRNLESVKTVHSSGLNVFDVLNHKHLVMTKDALLDIEGRLLK
ncbi:MAG: 50S ribosomal protein L4 [Proteobacteria bacterium]|nr:50S ribosomal protein L4 [Pseudomonadota bacterium]